MWMNKKLRKDRSGISTMVVAVVVIVIVIVAAAAVYIVFSNDDNKDDKEAFGIDTQFNYDISGTSSGTAVTGTMGTDVVGQNETQLFLDNDVEISSTTLDVEFDWYYMCEKSNGAPVDSTKKETKQLDTIDGTKTVTAFEYTVFGDMVVTAFVDEDSKITYELEISDDTSTITAVLKGYDIEESTPYDPPRGIGQKFTYNVTAGSDTYENALTIQSVAACKESTYGICYTLTSPYSMVEYEVGLSSQGLPVGAERTGQISSLETIDGTKTVFEYKLGDDDDEDDQTLMYIDYGNTNIIYKIVIKDPDGANMEMVLASYTS